jgi:hypothetical protein
LPREVGAVEPILTVDMSSSTREVRRSTIKNPMTRLESRVLWIAGVMVFVLVGLLVFNSWWFSFPPPRPVDVPTNAVYFVLSAVPFPASKSGDWITCWFDSGQKADRCRVMFTDGRLRYEGIYRPYRSKTPFVGSELSIDSKRMGKSHMPVEVQASSNDSSDPGVQFVPVVYLLNGDVLIPENNYAVGKEQLDR